MFHATTPRGLHRKRVIDRDEVEKIELAPQ